jgi:phage N-6-adenine-methyltransferase
MSAGGAALQGHTGNDELRTPDYLYDWLNRRFAFNFDAAASHENARCPEYATVDGVWERDECGPILWGDENGLTTSWEDRRVFLNPPYSRALLFQFIGKAIEERDHAEIIVMLVKWDTSTGNSRLLEQFAHIEPLRRVRYCDPDGKPLPAATFASAIAILRPSEPRP